MLCHRQARGHAGPAVEAAQADVPAGERRLDPLAAAKEGLMNKSIAVYGFATLALTCLVSSARADLLYTSGSFNDRCSPNGTDGCVPASASASFSLNGSSQLVVILSDTTVNPWQDSQNLGAISFQLQNKGSAAFLTGTVAATGGITGREIL